jgi:ParB/RepB/Spo0J family partition protein
MQIIPLSSINIANERQRQEFEPQSLMELTESIGRLGLLHAPVVRESADGKLWLVSGERRLRAIQDAWMLGYSIRYNGELVVEPGIPVVTMGELSPLEAEEAELDENLKRKDLTWQERAQAIERLHNLRVAQAEATNAGEALSPAEAVTHTVADTAEELTGWRDAGPAASVRKSIIVAKHLDDPDVAKAKSTDEAFKILKRKEEVKDNARLATTLGGNFTRDSSQLLQGDCLSWMQQADPEQFDVILTDPPYGMGAQDFGDAGGKLLTIEHHYDDSLEAWADLMAPWAIAAYALAKPQAHAYVFCDFDNFHKLKLFMEQAGWYVFRTPMLAYKLNSGRVPLPQHGPRRQYECILFANKGQKPVNFIGSDVIPCKGDDNLGHGAQKPVELYVELLRRSVRPGNAVLDTFAGTGTIFAAAKEVSCRAVGIEKDPGSFGIAAKRLEDLQ